MVDWDYLKGINPLTNADKAHGVLVKHTGTPIWVCTKCGEKIYGCDILFTIIMSSRGPKDTRIRCPRCRHLDTVGELRYYRGK